MSHKLDFVWVTHLLVRGDRTSGEVPRPRTEGKLKFIRGVIHNQALSQFIEMNMGESVVGELLA